MLNKTLLRALSLSAAILTAGVIAPSARAESLDCSVEEVAHVIGSRVHVKCSNSVTIGSDAIRWVAIAHNASFVKEFVALADAALLTGKKMAFTLPTSSANNTSGCNASNCRTPTEFRLIN